MKLKFLDGLMAAVKTKDEAQITAALVKVMDAAREEEDEARRKEEAEKDKARDEAVVKLVHDTVATAVRDAVAAAMKARDEESEAEKKKDADEEAKKAKKAEDEELEEELEEESGSKDARKAKDSALLADAFESVKMNAEIIAPGVVIPAFDAAASPKKTFRDCHCSLRRSALRSGLSDASTAEIIRSVRGRTLDAAEVEALSPSQVRSLFNGVAAIKRALNNGAATRDAAGIHVTRATEVKTPTQRFVDAAKQIRANRK